MIVWYLLRGRDNCDRKIWNEGIFMTCFLIYFWLLIGFQHRLPVWHIGLSLRTIALAAARAVKTEADNCFAFKHQGLDTYPSRNPLKPADSGEHGEREHMLPTACIMTPIKAINNCKSDTDISVTVMRWMNEAFNIWGRAQ